MNASSMLSDPRTFAEDVPHDELARLRREDPVAWIEETPLTRRLDERRTQSAGPGYWAVTRHRTITEVARNWQVFSSAERGPFLADPKSRQDLERTRQLLISMDAPEHARLRRYVAGAFTPKTVTRLRENIRSHARSLIRAIVERERFDVVEDVAAELPLLVLADLLGVPRADRSLMFDWSNALVGFDDPDFGGGDVAVYLDAFRDAFAYAGELSRAKRAFPGNDLTSALIDLELDGERLSATEFAHLFLLLVVAGNESTRHFLSGAISTLVNHPGQRRWLGDNPDALPEAVEELLRYVTPIMQFRRTATSDVDLSGRRIAAGDKVVLYFVSANRDDDVFEDPQRLDLGRSPNPHLAFGIGPHFCLGAHLAREEARTLLDEMLPWLDRLELLGPTVRLASNFMNGIKSMPAHIRRD